MFIGCDAENKSFFIGLISNSGCIMIKLEEKKDVSYYSISSLYNLLNALNSVSMASDSLVGTIIG